MAQRVGRGIALLFQGHGTRMGERSAARPGRTLPSVRTRYTLYRRLGGPQDRSGSSESLAPPGFDHRTVQPVVQSLYGLSYPVHLRILYIDKFNVSKILCHGTRGEKHNLYPTAFPYGNGMVLHFYQQQESSTTKTVHKVINRGLKTYV